MAAPLLHRLDRPFRDRRRSPTSLGTDFPLCFLTVRGRRTGEQRTVPLLYVADAERVVLIGSNFGRRRHPAWALNLEGVHEAAVSIDGVEHTYDVRPASPDERARYWTEAVQFWPGYEGYRKRVRREIKMFVLTPTREPAPVGSTP